MRLLARCSAYVLAGCALALPAAGDEIRLKDGKKLYGVIVSYEDNMFKVKTDFGYVLVEKDKIATIIPTAPAAPKTESKPAANKEVASEPTKPAIEPAKATLKPGDTAKQEPVMVSTKEVGPAGPAPTTPAPSKPEKAGKESKTPVTTGGVAESKLANQPTAMASAQSAAPPSPAKETGPPIREEVQGNTYINHTHGFRMYKAPSWSLIEEARNALPNAIVALGTSTESTLMVIGQEKTNDPLERAAANVEHRLEEAYDNYRRLEQKKTQVGGMPAIEYRYRGTAEDHDWSGTLVVLARGRDIFTVLGVTYADSDLIQIQENVIARAIASLTFTAQ